MKGKSAILWILLAVMAVVVYHLANPFVRAVPRDLPSSEFRDQVRRGLVESVRIRGEAIEGDYLTKFPPEATVDKAVSDLPGKTFVTRWLGTGDDLTRFLEENKVRKFDAIAEERSPLWQQIIPGLSFLLLVLFLIFMFRQMQAGGGKALSFGKSKARLLSESPKKVTFQDVAGIDEAKEELEEIIDFLKDPKKFTKLGGRIPKGVLLVGAPGTGKTLLARAIAGEAGVPFFTISGSDFVEMFVGVGASRVRDLFEQGKKHAPCIIFIDEIDAVGRHRGAGLGGGHDEREQTLNQLLVEMDGFESNEGVILIAATNRPDVLDPALLRPGRFDRHVVVPRPDLKGRIGILEVHTRKVPLSDDVNVEVLGRGTAGFAGADLENMVNEAALLAARQEKKSVAMIDFERAKDKIMLGKERKSLLISDEEKRITAYHESGHTVVAKKIPGADPVHKVTIIPRGMALGLTHQMPTEDKYTLNQTSAETTIAILMGGRVAEEIVFGTRTNGAGNDIEKATELARKMVCEWGMSDAVGPLAFGRKDEEIFLARDFTRHVNYSEQTSRLIDEEIRNIVMRNYSRTRKILEESRVSLDRVAEALLEYEVLEAEDVEILMAGGPLTKPKPAPRLRKPGEASKAGEENKPEPGLVPEPAVG
ncbi:MAG: ATP-dependent zinc metalloprotease FtsH [Pseudomonadota bacterium]